MSGRRVVVWQRWLALCIAVIGLIGASAGMASAEIRSLKLHHLHTGETAEIVYKRNGRYDKAGLKRIDWLLRDWRRSEPTHMDPRLLDLVWEAYRESGATGYIQVVCGYRAPATNAMLRSRSRGVAQKSQHMLGKAMDFFIPGVPLKKLRDIGLKMQGGGVGYYPTSGSPFVHMDVGNVRHWPGISRQELVRLFPNGKTLHVPSDGRPLPGYEQALAAYNARKSNGTPNIEIASAGGSTRKSGGLLAMLFGGGADEADDNADSESDSPAPARQVAAAKAAPAAKTSLPGIEIVSPDKAQRADVEVAAATSGKFDESDSAPPAAPETPETVIAALPARDVPLPDFAPRPKADVGPQTPDTIPFGMAKADAPAGTGASPDAEAVPAPALVAAAAAPDSMPFRMADADEVAQASDGSSPAAPLPPAAEAQAQAAQAIASNVPLPSWRPDRGTTPPELVQPKEQSALLALADASEAGNGASDALSVLPTARPAARKRDEIGAMLAKVPTDQYQVASVSAMPRSAFSDPTGVDAATPRTTLAALPAGSDPVRVFTGNVKTTQKEGRASARDARPEPKAKVVAAEPELARWAIDVAADKPAPKAEAPATSRLAYNIVRTAPTEVYTAGFQPGDKPVDPKRFTGSAVEFLSIARFQSK